jgi:hypothetical protein
MAAGAGLVVHRFAVCRRNLPCDYQRCAGSKNKNCSSHLILLFSLMKDFDLSQSSPTLYNSFA